jgi:ABC-2 type transport system ATP-binding protein
MRNVVECLNLTKKFGRMVALDNVNLTIEENKIYGLLGRNGAGKTTLLNILATHSFATKGEVKIFGENAYESSKAVSQLCYIKEAGNYLAQLKVKEIIELASTFYTNWDNDFSLDLLEQFNLDPKKKYPSLSKGMQSALNIVIGLASRAPLTIYDEPYIGLDAASRWLFYDILLKDYTENPRTIILSTHLIDEVSKIFESIIILDKGKVKLFEDLEDIREKSFCLSGRKDKIDAALKEKNVLHYEQIGGLSTAVVFDLLTEAEKKKLINEEVEIKPVSLQDLFIYITAGTKK